ncbi:MAG: response regulator [Planctomycetaceae bacterium]|nr:response regulator [Planctomycetaceae bacterium]
MTEKILFVDDEENVLRSLKRMLRRENYEILTASSGEEGLRLLKQHKVQVVVSDQRMPEMTGTEFLSQVRKLYPDTIRVVLSGYADAAAILTSINEGNIFRFLTKPWIEEELRVNLRSCLEQHAMVEQNKILTESLYKQNEELKVLAQQLEELMEIRTSSLELVQDIVSLLPMPVIGISVDRFITMINPAAVELLSTSFPISIGMEIDQALPVELIQMLEKCSLSMPGEQDNETECDRQITVNDVPVRVRSFGLQNKHFIRGGLLLLEPISCLTAK